MSPRTVLALAARAAVSCAALGALAWVTAAWGVRVAVALAALGAVVYAWAGERQGR